MRENSHQFFENKNCKYYPCHDGINEMNCLFCFCPLYKMEKCPGSYIYIESGDKKIKDCSNCTFPHQADNYDKVMQILYFDVK